MKKYLLLLFAMSILCFAELSFGKEYWEIGPLYSICNKIYTSNGFNKTDLILENGETVEYSGSSKEYSDYDFDYGNTIQSAYPSFGMYGRVGFYFKEKASFQFFGIQRQS